MTLPATQNPTVNVGDVVQFRKRSDAGKGGHPHYWGGHGVVTAVASGADTCIQVRALDDYWCPGVLVDLFPGQPFRDDWRLPVSLYPQGADA
jgi:hypothetical protein